MKIELIKSPSPGALAILAGRRANTKGVIADHPGAVGLIQGALAEMITAADIAEKAANVQVEEVRGVCPQHITLVAIYGDIAAVEYALKMVRDRFTDPL